jgi:hypothetical protein
VSAGYTFLGQSSGPRFNDGPELLVAFRYKRETWSRFSLELGASAAYLREEEGSGSLQDVLLGQRLGVLWEIAHLRSGTAYVLAGMGPVQEMILDADGDRLHTNYAGALDLGVGLGLGRFDLRATYSTLVGGDNLDARTTLGMGWRF